MFKKLTLTTTLAAVLAATASAAFAAPRYYPMVPPTGAQTWQDRGIAEDNGQVYRR